jgi:hypothetical protein
MWVENGDWSEGDCFDNAIASAKYGCNSVLMLASR